jgi:hypothetical protein
VEAQQVHGRGAGREDPRCRRPRPHRRARRAADVRLRHEGRRLRPVRAARARSPTSSPSTSPRPPRPSA